MIKKQVSVINDFSGGQDTRTPIIHMPLNKSPNMRNFHCAGVGNRLMKRGGFAKVNSSTVESDGIDVYYSPGYQTYDYALRDTAARTQISQGFKCNTSSTVTKVRLWLKKTGTPAGTDTITVDIQTDSSGVPSGTAVTNGVSTAVDVSDTITTSYAWVTFTFSTNPSLTAGTQYHLVLKGIFTVGASDYVIWGVDNYDVVYPDGSMSVNDGTTWVTETLYDACFEVYITNGSKGNDGVAIFDFSSKNMFLGIYGTQLYKMDKNSSGTPDGVWDAVGGGTAWDSYTKLMLHCDGTDAATTFTDEIGKTVTANGDAQLDTAQKKFGTASGLFDGTGDYLSVPDADDWNFGTSDFTIDFWFRTTDVTLNQGWIQQRVDANNEWNIRYTGATGILFFGCVSSGISTINLTTDASISLSNNTWHHISIVRNGSAQAFLIFIDGISKAYSDSGSNGSMPDLAAAFEIGRVTASSTTINGWIDEFRVSKGIARFTANFTVSTAAYSPGTLAITSSRFWTFADWQSGRALINTDIGLYTYTGTGSASAVSAAPIGKFVIIWKNYVFTAGIRGSPNAVRYCTLSDYTSWPAANSLSNQFNTNDGDVITGIRILKGKLYVFKRYSIHRVTHTGSNPLFQVDQLLGIGSPSHYSIKEVDLGGDIGTVLIFLTSEKKLAVFDGYNIQVINENLTEETNDLFQSSDDQPLSFSDMNYTYIDQFHAVVKSDTSEYILYSVLGSDTSVNYAFVFDYKTGGIYPYDGQIFSSSIYAISTNKSKKLYSAGYSGYLWEMESGNSDDSSSINAYWVSGKIRPEGVSLLNRLLQLAIHFKEISSGSTLNMNFQSRIDWNTLWTDAVSFNYDRADEYAFGKTTVFDIGTIENMFQVKIKDNSTQAAPKIYGLDLYGESLGVGVGDRATA